MGKFLLGKAEPETPEEAALRAAKRKAEADEWARKREEDMRLAVPRRIETLRKEAAAKVAEANQLDALLKEYPDLRMYVGRWEKRAFYSKTVNSKVNRFDLRHNCGCCADSPLEIWPYLETPFGNVYSDPTEFRVGERASLGGDKPYDGWDDKMRAAGIPDAIIGAVAAHFEQCAKEAREALDAEYGDGSE